MATTRRRGDGWEARWYAANGAERSKAGFPTKRAAKDYGTKQEQGKLVGVEYDPKSGQLTFRDAAALWLASRADLKARTLAGYREMLALAAERRRDTRRLGIDAVFGSYPLNAITREQIQEWVQEMTDAGKKPSTVRHNYFVVRQVLRQAVHDRRIPFNPADNVKLPSEHTKSGVVDDPAQFLTADQVIALVDATPWPYNVLVHLAGWSGLRAGELAGLQVGDVEIAPTPGGSALHVRRTVTRSSDPAERYDTPKTVAGRRRVPIDDTTADTLRDYLTDHARADDPAAPLFPAFRLTAPAPRTQQRRRGSEPEHWRTVADRQARTLAALTVDEAEARLQLDWDAPLKHLAFYKAVYRPAVLRANRLHAAGIAPSFRFHSLRHTYVSLCASSDIKADEISRYVGHTKISTTLDIYRHVFPEDHAAAMQKLGATARKARRRTANVVVPIRR